VLDNIKTGDRLPLDRGAPGKVLLAFEGCQGKAYDDARNKGYAMSFGDRDPHCAAVAVPVFKYPRELCGALSVSGPQTRFTTRYAQRILPQVMAAAEHLSRALGAQRVPAKNSVSPLRRVA
jgi:DNA-binding IclR family transcriptional regulator